MKLEVGMYVRFITGFDNKIYEPIVRIGKIEDINDYCITINVFSRQIIVTLKEFDELKRKEPSHNIIDLIEVGDYVNGFYVEDVKENFVNIATGSNYFQNPSINEDDIKSIVTKEMFANVICRI